ncbi:MAG: LamG-like jellyroll fold domain-containing protein [Patescibacteria group bacterium]
MTYRRGYNEGGAMGGFSLVQILLSLAVLALLLGIGVPIYFSFQTRNDLDIAASSVAQALRSAKARAEAMDGDSSWGVKIESGKITLFRGASFAGRDPAYDEVTNVPTHISATGDIEIVFAKFTGEWQIPPPGLVGHWKFDETTGATVAIDSSGNGNHGILTNMDPATVWVPGKIAAALAFDGVDDYVSLGNVAELRRTDTFSVSAWYNGVESNRSPVYASGFELVDKGFRISGYFASTDKRARIAWGNGVIGWPTPSNNPIPENIWTHIVATYDGTMKLYIDGAQQADEDTGAISYNANQATIGANIGSSPQRFNGLIDDVRVYNRALSAEEVQGLYAELGTFTLHSPGERDRIIIVNAEGVVDSYIGTPSIPPPSDTQAPSIPGGLTATAISSLQINLSWTASTDNIGVTGYKVYRCSGTGCTPVFNTTLGNVTSYSDTSGLSPSTLYRYQVTAIDAASNESAKQATPAEATTLAAPDTTAPAAVINLAASNPTASSIDLSWTAPGDDGVVGTAASYDIRYSTAAITDANWDSATQATGEPTPTAAGTSQSFTVTGLTAATTYYFAIKTSDEVPNISAISNVPSLATLAAPLLSGLIGQWKLDEGAGTTASDSATGDGTQNGTLRSGTTACSNPPTSGCPSWVLGRIGANALQLDGSDDRITTVSSLALPASFTYALWVNNPSNSTYETLLTVGSDRDLYLNNGTLSFYGNGDRSLGATLPIGSWRHVALVYDSSTQQMQAYVDGAPAGSFVSVSLTSISAVVNIGAWQSGGTYYDFLSGTVDEVQIYNRALTAAEIAALANQ